jgi:hypothetical protein
MTDIIEQFDSMVGHIVGINDERDVIPLLLGLKERWPRVRGEIERLRRENEELRTQLVLHDVDFPGGAR